MKPSLPSPSPRSRCMNTNSIVASSERSSMAASACSNMPREPGPRPGGRCLPPAEGRGIDRQRAQQNGIEVNPGNIVKKRRPRQGRRHHPQRRALAAAERAEPIGRSDIDHGMQQDEHGHPHHHVGEDQPKATGLARRQADVPGVEDEAQEIDDEDHRKSVCRNLPEKARQGRAAAREHGGEPGLQGDVDRQKRQQCEKAHQGHVARKDRDRQAEREIPVHGAS